MLPGSSISDASSTSSSTWRSQSPALLAVVLLLVLPFVLFWRVWWPDGGARRGFAAGDFVEQHVAMRTFVAHELRAGRLPLWDPYTFAGQPALADSLFATFYPPGWWQALFPTPMPEWVLEVEAIAHLGLAGMFTFLFLRRVTGHTGGALVGGLAFGLGGWATSYPMLQLIILETAVWLPAGLWWLERALLRRSLAGVAQAGLIFALALLAGHPQTFLYVAYTTAAYFGFRAWRLRLGWRWTVGAAALLGATVLGASAAQWLPSLQLYVRSPRLGLSYVEVAHGFALREWWGVVRPNPGAWSPLYVGLVPLGLTGLALARTRRAEVLFWGVVAGVALLVSAGGNGPLYPLLYRAVPGFNVFRDQERIALLWSFALAVLAGYGVAALFKTRSWPRAFLPLLVVLVFLDLFRANSGVILELRPPGGHFARTPLVEYLQRTGSPTWRTSSEGNLPGGANAGAVFELRDVVGSGPLYLAALDRFTTELPELRWWQLLNVQHLLTTRPLQHGALLPVMAEGEQHLYQVFVGGRDVWITHAAEIVAGQDAALTRSAAPELDPMAVAVLEAAPRPAPQPATGDEHAEVIAFEHQHLVTEVTLNAPGVVMWSEVDYPGWRVWANGEPQPSLRAFGLLRAVALPPGTWRVEWHFEPPLVRAGLAASVATVGVVIVLGLRRRRQTDTA